MPYPVFLASSVDDDALLCDGQYSKNMLSNGGNIQLHPSLIEIAMSMIDAEYVNDYGVISR